MYPAKVMTAGEGGFVVTNNKKLRDKLLMIRNHGMINGYDTRILWSETYDYQKLVLPLQLFN